MFVENGISNSTLHLSMKTDMENIVIVAINIYPNKMIGELISKLKFLINKFRINGFP